MAFFPTRRDDCGGGPRALTAGSAEEGRSAHLCIQCRYGCGLNSKQVEAYESYGLQCMQDTRNIILPHPKPEEGT